MFSPLESLCEPSSPFNPVTIFTLNVQSVMQTWELILVMKIEMKEPMISNGSIIKWNQDYSVNYINGTEVICERTVIQ